MSGIDDITKDIEEMFKYAGTPAGRTNIDDNDDEPGEGQEDGRSGEAEPASAGAEPTEGGGQADELATIKAELAAVKAQLQATQNADTQSADQSKAAPKRAELTELVTEEEFATALTDRTKFNEILLRVYNMAREDTLVELPSVVEITSQRQKALTERVTKFYTDNEDLKEYSGVVAMVANTVAAEHPDKDIDYIFTETAKRTRQMLKIQEGASKREAAREEPAFPRRPGASPRGGTQDTRTEQQKQIAQMMGLK